jgi:hypothetical protein
MTAIVLAYPGFFGLQYLYGSDEPEDRFSIFF